MTLCYGKSAVWDASATPAEPKPCCLLFDRFDPLWKPKIHWIPTVAPIHGYTWSWPQFSSTQLADQSPRLPTLGNSILSQAQHVRVVLESYYKNFIIRVLSAVSLRRGNEWPKWPALTKSPKCCWPQPRCHMPCTFLQVVLKLLKGWVAKVNVTRFWITCSLLFGTINSINQQN